MFTLSILLAADSIFKFSETTTNTLVEARKGLCETLIYQASFLIHNGQEFMKNLKQNDTTGFPVLGLLYFDQESGGEDHRHTVFLRNLYEIPAHGGSLTEEEFLKGPRQEFDSFETILDAGWIVD